jgi:hypothetical protein
MSAKLSFRRRLGDILIAALLIAAFILAWLSFGCVSPPLTSYEQRAQDVTKAQAELIGKITQPQPQPITVGNIGSGASVTITPTMPPGRAGFDGSIGSNTSSKSSFSFETGPALWMTLIAAGLLILTIVYAIKSTRFGKAADRLAARSLDWAKDKMANETDPDKLAIHREYVAELELLKAKLKDPPKT